MVASLFASLGLAALLPRAPAVLAGAGAASRNCSTGDASVPCVGSVTVRWINMDDRTDRAEHTSSMLERMRTREGSSIAAVSREPGVALVCDRGGPMQPCTVALHPASCASTPCALLTPAYSALSEQRIWEMEHHPDSYTRSIANITRRGIIGCFASHVAALTAFRDDATRGNATEFMLILEDDVILADDVLETVLPAALAQLAGDAPWHVVRLSIPAGMTPPPHKPRLNESDRVRSAACSTECKPPVYLAADPEGLRMDNALYMTTRAVLVQRRTVDEVLRHVLSRGMLDVDIAYKLPRHAPYNITDRPFRTYAVDTDAVIEMDDAPSIERPAGREADFIWRI